MPTKSFHFEFYSIHAHLENDAPVDYGNLFQTMSSLKGHHSENGNHHVFIGTATWHDGQLFLVIYTGYSERNTLFFDLTSQRELTESMLPGRFQARKTYVLIDARKRVVGMEVKRGYISPSSLAYLMQEFAHTKPDFSTIEIDFNPIADVGFAARLAEFTRIQAATITIARPNVDWTDRHDQLTKVASESDARTLDVTAHAKRGRSLARTSGIIEFIKQGATSTKSMFKKIKIVGATDGDTGLITLNLSKHIRHADVAMEVNERTGLPTDGDVRSTLVDLLKTVKPDGEDGAG